MFKLLTLTRRDLEPIALDFYLVHEFSVELRQRNLLNVQDLSKENSKLGGYEAYSVLKRSIDDANTFGTSR